MEKYSLIEKTKSKYIINIIFNYIKDKRFMLKLFKYSKCFQVKFNINLADYIDNYLEDLGLQLDSIFQFPYEIKTYINFNDEKTCQDIAKFYVKKINEINKKEKDNIIYENPERKISQNCPIIKYLSKNGILKYFSIIIHLDQISCFSPDFLTLFSELNNSNSEYKSLTVIFSDLNNITNLNDFKIDFNKIVKLTFYRNKTELLERMFKNEPEPKIKSNILENLIPFTNLKYLHLESLQFEGQCSFNFFNLEELSLYYVSNIIIKENSCLNLKKIDMNGCSNIESENNECIKLPKLQILNYKNQKINNLIDFVNLNNLKKFSGYDCDFILLQNSSLDIVDLNSYDSTIETINVMNLEIEVKIMEKLLSMKSLNKISLGISYLNNNLVSEINGLNTRVWELNIFWQNKQDCTLYELQNKFPNLLKISVKTPSLSVFSVLDVEDKTRELEIKENLNCKINEVVLSLIEFGNFTRLYYNFENLIKIDIHLETFIINMDKSFPIFSDNCKTILKNLNTFNLFTKNFEFDFSILTNIYNNIICMPNLKEILLEINKEENVDLNFYQNFITKLLLLNLDKITVRIENIPKYDFGNYPNNDINKYYQLEELKQINPNIKKYQFKNILIRKYN